MYSVAAFSVVPGGHGHPRGLGWNYQGYGRQPRVHAASHEIRDSHIKGTMEMI